MKVLIVLAFLVATALAVPTTKSGIQFNNLYKDPIGEIKAKPQHGRIINGEIAKPHSIPHQAFLTMFAADGSGWYCGGSLISPTTILTAGHCGDDDGKKAVIAQVVLGAINPQTKETDQVLIQAKDIIVHEKFNYDEILNDIAVINLPEAVKLSDNIQLIKLPTKNDVNETYEGQTAKVSGWGLTDGFGNQLSSDLRYIEETIISNKECSEVFRNIPDYQVCISGGNKKSSCNGDSGGPVTVGDVQIGLVSYGISFCLPGYPSAFTRTTSFLDWIIKNSK